MDPILTSIPLQDCPLCGGPAIMHEEGGWAFSVYCGDCGAHTALAEFRAAEERQQAAETAAYTWNLGKVVHPGPGE